MIHGLLSRSRLLRWVLVLISCLVLATDLISNLARVQELPDRRRALVLQQDTSLYSLAVNSNRYARERFGLAALFKGVVSGKQLRVPSGLAGRDMSLERISGVEVVAADAESALSDDEAQALRDGACRTLSGPVKLYEERFSKAFLLCDPGADAYSLHVRDGQLFVLPLTKAPGQRG